MSDFTNYVTQRLLTYDPTLDVSEGSVLKAIVIDPIVDTLGADPLDTDASQLMRSKLLEAFPDLTLGAGDALVDIVINAASLFVEPYRAELSRIARSQSLADPSSLSVEDIDALASNWAVSRITGARSRVTVTVTLSNLRDVSVNAGIRFLTADGLAFRPVGNYTITAADIRSTSSSGVYSVLIDCISEQSGTTYNIDANQIVASQNMNNVASVTNVRPGLGGVDEESGEAFATRLVQVINERSLVSDRGIRAKVLSDNSNIDRVEVVGFGDTEMTRDAVDAETRGVIRGSGFSVVYSSVAVISLYGGYVEQGDTLNLRKLSDGTFSEVEITEILLGPIAGGLVQGGTAYVVRGDFPVNDGSVWSVVGEGRPSAIFGEEIVTSSVHLGGKADVYLTPQTDERAFFDVEDFTLSSDIEGTSITEYGTVGLKSALRVFSADNAGVVTDQTERLKDIQWLLVGEGDLKGAHKIISLRVVDAITYVVIDRSSSLADGEVVTHNSQWFAMNHMSVPMSKAEVTVLPRGGELINCTLFPNNTRVVLSATGIQPIVKPGDTIFVEKIDFRSEIVSVLDNSVEIATEPVVTGVFSAVILRSVRQGVGPVIEPVSLEIGDASCPYGPSLGARVVTTSSPKTISEGELGRVLPHYTSLFRRDDRRFSIDVNAAGYSVLNYGRIDPDHDVFSNGTFTGSEGSAALRIGWQLGLQADTIDFEVEVPNDLFTPGPYTLIACYGDLDVDGLLDRLKALRIFPDATPISLYNQVPSHMPQPALGTQGDIITLNGNDYVIDRVYPIEIPIQGSFLTNNDTELFVQREKVIRITLVRLMTEASPPSLAYAEELYRFNYTRVNDVVIDLYDFISMLCRPTRLLDDDVIDQMGLDANNRIQAAGLPVGDPVPFGVDDYDENPCSVVRPSSGFMDLYYLDERSVEIETLRRALYSHETTTASITSGVLDKRASNPSKAGTLYVPHSGMSTPASSTWSRLANPTLIFQDITDESHILSPYAPDTADVLAVKGIGAALSEVSPIAGDEIMILNETYMTESEPPVIEAWTLYLDEDQNGLSPLDWLQNDAFKNALSIDGGNTVIGDTDFNLLKNGYGTKVRDLLISLDPADRLSINFNMASQVARFTFYLCVPSQKRYGLPIFTTQAGQSTLTSSKLYEYHAPSIPSGLKGDLLWIDTSSSASDKGKEIVSVQGASLMTESVIPFTTGSVASRGWVYSDPSNSLSKVILAASFVDYLDANGNRVRAESAYGDNASGVLTGGTSRLFVESDIGKTITFVNNVWSPDGVINGLPEEPVIERTHLGVFTITAVESREHVDIETGVIRVYEQTITLDRNIDFALMPTALSIAETNATYIPLFFQLSSDAIPVLGSDLKTCIACQVYSHSPTLYKVAAIDADYSDAESQQLYLMTPDDQRPSLIKYGIFEEEILGNIRYNASGATNVPFYIKRFSSFNVSTEPYIGGIHRLTLPFMSSSPDDVPVGSAHVAYNFGDADGYFYEERGHAYSSAEDTYLMVPPKVGQQDALLLGISHVYLSSLSIRAISGQYISTRHRVVCSDLLIRRALPCHLGVFMRYDGGSRSPIVREDIKAFTKRELSVTGEISASDVIALAHKRGARRVSPSVLIYYVLSDLDRRLHISFIEDTFDNSELGEYRGTRRITGVRVPDTQRLGVTFDVKRS